jgi:hypothetical protein
VRFESAKLLVRSCGINQITRFCRSSHGLHSSRYITRYTVLWFLVSTPIGAKGNKSVTRNAASPVIDIKDRGVRCVRHVRLGLPRTAYYLTKHVAPYKEKDIGTPGESGEASSEQLGLVATTIFV